MMIIFVFVGTFIICAAPQHLTAPFYPQYNYQNNQSQQVQNQIQHPTTSSQPITRDKSENDVHITNPHKPPLWPMPYHYASELQFLIIEPQKFIFTYPQKSQTCSIFMNVIQRYKQLLFIENCSKKKWNNPSLSSTAGMLYNLTISFAGFCEMYPYHNMDEQYTIRINTIDRLKRAELLAPTVWAVIRGLETFSQLVFPLQQGLFAISTTMILDNPRFTYRGLRIDTSKIFIPVPAILQNLDFMAQVKLNVFHWAFSSSVVFNNRRRRSINASDTFFRQVYSSEDVAEILEYARLRGIRVIPEINYPVQSQKSEKGKRNVITGCDSAKSSNSHMDSYGLKAYYGHMAQFFLDMHVHLAANLGSSSCWISDILNTKEKISMVYQDLFHGGFHLSNKDTIVHVWKDNYESELSKLTAKGFNVILSSCWHLNKNQNWVEHYHCDPQEFRGSKFQKTLVNGGEVYVTDKYVDFHESWAQIAATAERLWSSNHLTSNDGASSRLEELFCRMTLRGIKLQPLKNQKNCECGSF